MVSARVVGFAAAVLVTFVSPARADGPPVPVPKSDAPPLPAEETPPASSEPAASSSSSVHMTYESMRVERPAQPAPKRSPDDSILLHGFRLGYGHVMNYDVPVRSFDGKSLKDKTGLRAPHHFLLGYEVMYRVISHSWLNVLLLGNVMIAGIEQSKFLPSANLLIGGELDNSFQVGLGANLSPLSGSEAHAVVAAGWTPRVGTIYTPVHFYFIPDVDGVHRMGVTTGVTF